MGVMALLPIAIIFGIIFLLLDILAWIANVVIFAVMHNVP